VGGQRVDQEWLTTEEGHRWLETDDGLHWLTMTQEGRWWSQDEDARRWYRERWHERWRAYFAGDLSPPSHDVITAESAPRIGSRVRIKDWMGPHAFGADIIERGELCIVVGLRLDASGAVGVELRAIDGRTCGAQHPDDFEPA
jgi:hypothetical protein